MIQRLRCPKIASCPFELRETTCSKCQKTVKEEAADELERMEKQSCIAEGVE
mgnify:CR=1 FL=1